MLGARPKNSESHGSAGGKVASLGFSYQLAVLMYTFLVCVRRQVEFCIGAEVKEAGKFDDVVIRYRKKVVGKRLNRLVELKNKADPDKSRITLTALSTKNRKSDFGLIMYFKSFCDIKANFTNENEEIEDLTIYTNGQIKLEDKLIVNEGSEDEVTFIMKDTFEERNVEDELFLTKLYCIAKDSEERRKWSTYLIKNSTRNDSELKNDVELFLNKLSFALKQPEENELIAKVQMELKRYVINVHEAYAEFHTYIYTWLAGKECSYLKGEDVLKLIEDLKGKYGRFNFGVDRPVLNFSGRESELEDLKKAFEYRNQRVVICGLGGVGKTQLARKFAERHTESYSCVFWLKSESYEDLKKSIEMLASCQLGIKGKTADGKAKGIVSILEEVRNALQNRKCLFIFDNVPNNFEGSTDGINLNDILMKLPSNSALLMTSRRSDWDNFSKCRLEQLSNNDAAILIRTSLKDVTFEDKQVKNLAKVLQYYPLALQQAIAYIKKKAEEAKRHERVYSIDSYLETFKENYKELLEHPVQDLNEDEYRKTTLTTWNMTMEDIRKDKIRGALSEQILWKISYFFPDEIPMSDINECFGDEGEEKVESAILLLQSYSMVNLLDNGQCSVHRLVQKVTRLRLKEMEGEHGVLYSLWVVFRKLILKEEGEKELLESLLNVCEKLDVRNVVSIWEHCKEHKDLIRKHSKMPKYVIDNFIKNVRYAHGYMYGKRLVKVMETILDPMDTSMNEVNFALAEVTYMNGLHGECYDISKKVWEQSCIIPGEEHWFTLRVRNQMAKVLYYLGRDDEWRELSKEVFDKCEKVLGREDQDSIIARVDYATCLRISGKLDESYTMIKEACETCETVLGPQHSHFIKARDELAMVLMELKKYDESLDILRNVWEWKKNNKGEEHPDTLLTRHSMGLVQLELCNYRESKEMIESVYEWQRRTLGEEHPNTLVTRHNMGLVQLELCNYTESKEIFKSLYECERRTLGEEHPDTLSTRHNMGIVQLRLCNYFESKVIFESVYECRRRTLGEEHPLTLKTREWIESVLKKTDHSAT